LRGGWGRKKKSSKASASALLTGQRKNNMPTAQIWDKNGLWIWSVCDFTKNFKSCQNAICVKNALKLVPIALWSQFRGFLRITDMIG
jgi:hypothetical protein